MATERIVMLAPAKVNLYLEVGGIRPDGYHEVTTVLQALDDRVADTLVLERAAALNVVCEPDIGVPAESNLVTRAIRALAQAVGVKPRLSVVVTKHIPDGAGLGGGSSDAAAALVGACRLWGIDPAAPEVTEVARSLGADVPFFLSGGTALFVERGDVLQRRLPTPELHLVVVNPGVPTPTAEVYRAYDRRGHPQSPGVQAALDALAGGGVGFVAAGLFNGLTAAAQTVSPLTAHVLATLASADGVRGVLLSGSGSSAFGICDDAAGAERAAVMIVRQGCWARATASSDRGVRAIG
jgi:4-diphosphocytidyl-2-C-methyl-D-erythritol kinase